MRSLTVEIVTRYYRIVRFSDTSATPLQLKVFMLREPTISKLQQLRLPVMAATWQAQANDAALSDLPFDERLALLVDAELLERGVDREEADDA